MAGDREKMFYDDDRFKYGTGLAIASFASIYLIGKILNQLRDFYERDNRASSLDDFDSKPISLTREEVLAIFDLSDLPDTESSVPSAVSATISYKNEGTESGNGSETSDGRGQKLFVEGEVTSSIGDTSTMMGELIELKMGNVFRVNLEKIARGFFDWY